MHVTIDDFRKQLADPVARERLGLNLTGDQAAAILADDILLDSWYRKVQAASPGSGSTRRPVARPVPKVPTARTTKMLAPAKLPKVPGCGTGCLILIGVIVLIGIVVAVVSSTAPHQPDNSSGQATVECQDRVRAALKSPSTASFQVPTVTGSSPNWTISGTVDSQNSFGATLRTSYSCDVHFKGDLVSVDITSLG
jgi:hypothetical protein